MHPILFTIPYFNIPIYSYGTLLGISVVIGWFAFHFQTRNEISTKTQLIFISSVIFTSLLIARMLYIFTNLHLFQGFNLATLLSPGHGGLVAYGGFLGGFLATFIFSKIKHIPFLSLADTLTPLVLIGLCLTRIGCFLAGCDFGKPIDTESSRLIQDIAVQFPSWNHHFPEQMKFLSAHDAHFYGAPAYIHHLNEGLISHFDTWSLPVYPTQLFSSLNAFVAILLCIIIRTILRFQGHVFFFATAYYGATRFLLEFLRGDVDRGQLGLFSTSQWIGLITFVFGCVCFIRTTKQIHR